MNQGWISLYRKIGRHWLWPTGKFTPFEAWIDLLLTVNHVDNKCLIDGQLVTVERGTCITSIRKLCDKWKWSNSKVTRFLNQLENDEMIVVKSDTKKTVLTVVNYGFYQGDKDEKATQKRRRNDAEATQKHTNNNVNNVNNVNNENNSSSTPANAFSFYESNFGMLKPFVSESIGQWIDDLNEGLVVEAMKISIMRNKNSFGYAEGILRDWQSKNVKSLNDVAALDKEFQRNKDTTDNSTGVYDSTIADLEKELEDF